jgi:hypothetical protein
VTSNCSPYHTPLCRGERAKIASESIPSTSTDGSANP